jgi:signal transduction histidine kinase
MAKKISRTFWKGCSKREVLLSICHELDQPILAIKGYGNLFLKANLSEDEKRKAAQQIVDYAEFLESLRDSIEGYLAELRESTPTQE